MEMRKYGEWAFIIGILLAVVAGILSAWSSGVAEWTGLLGLVMLVIGIIVGFLNVTEKETTAFLVAAIALLATASVEWSRLNSVAGVATNLGTFIGTMLVFLGAFVAPAAVIVAVKAVWALAKEA